MVNFTYFTKQIICPRMNAPIYAKGKYRMSTDPQKPYEATFCFPICSLVENSEKPIWEQNPEWKGFICPTPNCSALFDFPKVIDVRTSKSI